MADMDIEWKDVEKKIEEDEFAKEKQATLREQQAAAAGKAETKTAPETDNQYETIGLSSMISEVWNETAVEKGYDPVTEQQDEFLRRHTARLEEKYLKDRMNLLPELEAALSHAVVYLPKWLKHIREAKKE